MQRVTGPDVVADLFGAGKDGFTEGDPGLVAGTPVSDDWLNAVQEEIANAVELHGVALDPTQRNQMGKLIRSPRWDVDPTKDPKWDTPRVAYKMARYEQYILGTDWDLKVSSVAELNGANTQANAVAMRVDLSALVPDQGSIVSVDVLMKPGHANPTAGNRASFDLRRVRETTAQVVGANFAVGQPDATTTKQWINIYTDALGVFFHRANFTGPVSSMAFDRPILTIVSGVNMSGSDTEWIYGVVVGVSEPFANRPC